MSNVEQKDGSHKDLYDELGLKYQDYYGHDPDLLKFIDEAQKILPKDATVLDVGCGTGEPVASRMAAFGCKVHGIDFSQTMVELSRKQVPAATFEHGDLLHYSPKEPFDAVFAIFSLFRISVEEMHIVHSRWDTWLKKGGYLFIGTMLADDFPTTPDMFDENRMYAEGISRKFMGDQRGTTLWTRKGWKTMLEGAGFKQVFAFTQEFKAPEEADCELEPHHFMAWHRE